MGDVINFFNIATGKNGMGVAVQFITADALKKEGQIFPIDNSDL
jgi:hypothetical protein